MAPVLRMGEAAAAALVVEAAAKGVALEVKVGRDVVEVGDAEVAEVDVLDDAPCTVVSLAERLSTKR
jgi:hypothetical protein